MKTRSINRAVRVLLGKRLWSAGRAADLEWFAFGEPRMAADPLGGSRTVGEYALHVQCAWRIAGPAGLIVGSQDRYYPRGDVARPAPGFQWDEVGANRCDELISTFIESYATESLVVDGCSADRVGGLRVSLGGEFLIELFPDSTAASEYWRMFQPATNGKHLVITPLGVQDG